MEGRLLNRSVTLTFRATPEALIGKFALPFTFFGLALYTWVHYFHIDPFWGMAGGLILAFIGVSRYILPMAFNWMRMDAATLEVNLSGRHFQVYWHEILAAWMLLQGQSPYLCLGTRLGTVMLPLRFLNVNRIWGEVCQRVPPKALEADAMEHLPDYLEWEDRIERLVNEPLAPQQIVDHWIMRVAGWAGLTFFTSVSVDALLTGQGNLFALFIGPTLLAGISIFNWGVTIFDSEGVTRRTMIGTWRIRWDELRRVEISPLNIWLVLEGRKKRVALSGPALWPGAEREEMLTILRAQAEHRHIPLQRTVTSLFKPSRNSRTKAK